MRERRDPRDDVAELVYLVVTGPLAYGLGELAHLFAQPCNRRGNASRGIAFAVRGRDDLLERVELHRYVSERWCSTEATFSCKASS